MVNRTLLLLTGLRFGPASLGLAHARFFFLADTSLLLARCGVADFPFLFVLP